MQKEQLILLLKNYKENKARLKLKLRERENILQKIESLKNVSLSATSYKENGYIHSKNTISDKVGNKVSNNLDIEADLKVELKKVEEEIIKINSKVEEVEIRLEGLKYKEREILTAYYIDGRSLLEIGEELYFKLFSQTRSERTIQKIIEKATEKIVQF